MVSTSPRCSTPAATSRAAIALRAWSRSMGMRPIAGNSRRVVHDSMYSALPMKNARRGIDWRSATESKKEMWFAATITPPACGTRARPSTFTRVNARYSGVVTDLMTRYRRSESPGAGRTSGAPSTTEDITVATAGRYPEPPGHESDSVEGTSVLDHIEVSGLHGLPGWSGGGVEMDSGEA